MIHVLGQPNICSSQPVRYQIKSSMNIYLFILCGPQDRNFASTFFNIKLIINVLTTFLGENNTSCRQLSTLINSDIEDIKQFSSLCSFYNTFGGGAVEATQGYMTIYGHMIKAYNFLTIHGRTLNLLENMVVEGSREREASHYYLNKYLKMQFNILIIYISNSVKDLMFYTTKIVYKLRLLVPYLETTVVHASVLSLVFISLERYHVICRPLQAGYRCTKAKAIVAIATIWTLAAASAGPTLIFQDYQEEPTGPECLFLLENPWAGYYFLAMSVLFFFLPLVLLVILYSVIARQLLIDTYNLTHKKNSPQMRARKQVVIMLSTVVVFFFICLLPLRVFFIWIIESPIETIHSLGNETFYNILWFCRIMYYINSCINPILYNMTSTRFRTAFLRLCGCRRTLQLHEYNSNTSYNNQSMANIRLNYGTNCSLVYKSMYSKSVASQQFSYVSTGGTALSRQTSVAYPSFSQRRDSPPSPSINRHNLQCPSPSFNRHNHQYLNSTTNSHYQQPYQIIDSYV
ncbi:unnamed protein product, partial [Meganyctiphanes norvegica]